MKFREEKKKSIIFYILEKISQGNENVSQIVAEVCGVNQTTVHSYINELVNKEIIRRVKRGKYELVRHETKYDLKRSDGDLDTDTHAYDICLYNHIKELPQNIQSIWEYTFSEMINNVMDHSEAENVRIIVEQDYINTTVFIQDDGIGIFEKIKDYFKMNTIDDAICELFKGKLTTDSRNHSGEGIFFSSKMMDGFFILSSGKIFTNNKFDDSRIIDIANRNIPGTCVIMSLSNFTQKQAHEVFDSFSDVDGGFTKTRIPLKNIFDAAPISRSQAKRICNRLEKFQEVELDFEDLEWMGQGFAHQIFVVFERTNPQIKIVPVNMNEAVEKMYNHVINS